MVTKVTTIELMCSICKPEDIEFEKVTSGIALNCKRCSSILLLCEMCDSLIGIPNDTMMDHSQNTTQSGLVSSIESAVKYEGSKKCHYCKYVNFVDIKVRLKLGLQKHPGIIVNNLQLVFSLMI